MKRLIIGTLGLIGLGCMASQSSWPDLNVVQGAYPNGSCSVDGSATPGSPKALSNRLKNRYKLPEKFELLTWNQALKLPLAEDNAWQNKGVSLVGYVKDVHYGGSSGESCNCRAKDKSVLDIHIDIVRDPMDPKWQDQSFVGEVTHRGRILAEKGLLSSNVGNDWSQGKLRDKLLGRWVRFSGWLFYDPDHLSGGFREDPNDQGVGGRNESPNWRLSGWEIHPIMGIEVLPGKPSGDF